jgi:hypothetical protein
MQKRRKMFLISGAPDLSKEVKRNREQQIILEPLEITFLRFPYQTQGNLIILLVRHIV